MFGNDLLRTTRTRLSSGIFAPLPSSFAILAIILVAIPCGFAKADTITVATFADPSVASGNPLFTVDLVNDVITGGWADSKTGLNLVIPYSGHIYTDAFFTTTSVSYTGGIAGGDTGGGTIKFFKDGQLTSTPPLIQIAFDKGHVTPYGLGASDISFIVGGGDNVVITGSEIGVPLTDETFSFSFANQQPLSGSYANGYTATASFTSSAAVPEPSTLVLLGMGAIAVAGWLWRKRLVVSS